MNVFKITYEEHEMFSTYREIKTMEIKGTHIGNALERAYYKLVKEEEKKGLELIRKYRIITKAELI